MLFLRLSLERGGIMNFRRRLKAPRLLASFVLHRPHVLARWIWCNPPPIWFIGAFLATKADMRPVRHSSGELNVELMLSADHFAH